MDAEDRWAATLNIVWFPSVRGLRALTPIGKAVLDCARQSDYKLELDQVRFVLDTLVNGIGLCSYRMNQVVLLVNESEVKHPEKSCSVTL